MACLDAKTKPRPTALQADLRPEPGRGPRAMGLHGDGTMWVPVGCSVGWEGVTAGVAGGGRRLEDAIVLEDSE